MENLKRFLKKLLYTIIGIVVVAGGLFIAYKLIFTEEKKNIIRRKLQTYTGFNLTVTVYSYDGKVLRVWKGVSKVTSGHKQGQNYVYFYTKDGRYVQIPHSAMYIAEQEKGEENK
jgi:hypothetical protein